MFDCVWRMRHSELCVQSDRVPTFYKCLYPRSNIHTFTKYSTRITLHRLSSVGDFPIFLSTTLSAITPVGPDTADEGFTAGTTNAQSAERSADIRA